MFEVLKNIGLFILFFIGIPIVIWLFKYLAQWFFEIRIDCKKAYSKLYTELSTRITMQALPDNQGTEEGALKSLYKTFLNIRDLKLEHPLSQAFQEDASKALEIIRPFTTKWHALKEKEKLKEEEFKKKFRKERRELQNQITIFAQKIKIKNKSIVFRKFWSKK